MSRTDHLEAQPLFTTRHQDGVHPSVLAEKEGLPSWLPPTKVRMGTCYVHFRRKPGFSFFLKRVLENNASYDQVLLQLWVRSINPQSQFSPPMRCWQFLLLHHMENSMHFSSICKIKYTMLLDLFLFLLIQITQSCDSCFNIDPVISSV